MKAYRYGFNGKEKDQNGEFGLNSYDYGARIYNPAIGRFLSIDPLQKEYEDITPYGYARQSPISNIDVDGKYALFIHFMITRFKLKKLGVSDVIANLIAHYASTYADNPAGVNSAGRGVGLVGGLIVEKNVTDSQKENSLFEGLGGALSKENANHLRYNPSIDYSGTKDSQSESDAAQMLHSTRSFVQKDAVSSSLATSWSITNAWENLFASAAEGHMLSFEENSKGVELLGLALHSFQDSQAHQGAIFRATILNGFGLFSWNGNQHDLGNDSSPNRALLKRSLFITESALIIHQVLTGDNSNLHNGQSLFVKGMLKNRSKQLNKALRKAGYTTSSGSKKGEIILKKDG